MVRRFNSYSGHIISLAQLEDNFENQYCYINMCWTIRKIDKLCIFLLVENSIINSLFPSEQYATYMQTATGLIIASAYSYASKW